jgi:hypothetical protein
MAKHTPAASGVDLVEHVRRAIAEPMPANEIAAVLDAAQQAEDAAHKQLRIAETAALDPLLDAVTVGQTWHEAEEARLAARRWGRALELLRARLTDVREAEREVVREQRFAAAVASRDAIEAELRDKYPALAAEIASLLARLEEAERAVAACNRDLPKGASHLATAEMLARGVPGNFMLGPNRVTPLTLAVRLPILEGEASAFGAAVWPAHAGVTANRAA